MRDRLALRQFRVGTLMDSSRRSRDPSGKTARGPVPPPPWQVACGRCQAIPLARVPVAKPRSDSSGCCASYIIQSLAATGDTTVA